MPVRIARDEAAAPAELGLRQLRSARNQLPVGFCERELEGGGLTHAQIDLPVPDIRSRVSTGRGRPPAGVTYSRNSMPGPCWARNAVIRRWAPKTLFRCSCSVP